MQGPAFSNRDDIVINYGFGAAALAFALPLIGLMAYLAFAPPVPRSAHIFLIVMLSLITIGAIVFAVRRWTRKAPVLVIGKEGKTEYIRGYGLISWQEITGARIKKTQAGKVLILDVTEPARFANIKPSLTNRANGVKGDVQIEIAEMDHKPDDIFSEVQLRLRLSKGDQ